MTGAASSPLWSDPPPRPTRPPLARRVAGWVLVLLVLVIVVTFTVGVWNPGRYVVLQKYFGDPFTGAVLATVLAVVASWLLLPVRAEADQGRRVVLRWGLIILVVASVIGYAYAHPLFVYDMRTVATSPDDQLTIALVTPKGDQDLRQLRVWRGHGMSRRDLGGLGRPCGPLVKVSFTDNRSVHVASVYGDFDLRLAPDGRPLNSIGPTCAG